LFSRNHLKQAKTGYYRHSVIYAQTGLALYNWLDGTDRNLQRALDRHQCKGIILAIAATERLAHLPWEILHDGNSFLVQQNVVPVRWVKIGGNPKLAIQDEPENRALNVLFMASSPRGMEPELAFEEEEARILKATQRKPLSLTVEESGCLTWSSP